ncbi:MAG: glycosyltransferase family 2 protein [Gammaproteobacteria bacterium]
MKSLFWLSAWLALYPWLVYPPLLWLLARLRPRQGRPDADFELPALTVVVSAHNEAAVIEEKIRTTLATDYPADRLTALVVSDASTDDTNAIVTRLAAETPNVRLLAFEEHRGKTAGLNLAMAEIETPVVVFTDANAIFEPVALRRLVEPLADPAVGYVVGAQHYARDEAGAAGENEGLYWRYELALKTLESRFDSVVGGDGAIYAVRRELYRELAAEDINDFVNPLQVIAQGYRGLFQPEARAFEEPADDFLKEFRRKRRIVCRSWGALTRYWPSLDLPRYPRFTFMLFSHKVIRWFTMLWLVLAGAAALVLTARGAGGIYVLALFALVGLFALGALGRKAVHAGESLPAWQSVPYYFLLSNYAALLGVVDYLRGNRYVTWQHVRSS